MMTRAQAPRWTAAFVAIASGGIMLGALALGFAGYAAGFAVGRTDEPAFEHVQQTYTVVPPWTPACCTVLLRAERGEPVFVTRSGPQ
jgi:hypothetical protein